MKQDLTASCQVTKNNFGQILFSKSLIIHSKYKINKGILSAWKSDEKLFILHP